jgi:hypothetical protein
MCGNDKCYTLLPGWSVSVWLTAGTDPIKVAYLPLVTPRTCCKTLQPLRVLHLLSPRKGSIECKLSRIRMRSGCIYVCNSGHATSSRRISNLFLTQTWGLGLSLMPGTSWWICWKPWVRDKWQLPLHLPPRSRYGNTTGCSKDCRSIFTCFGGFVETFRTR